MFVDEIPRFYFQKKRLNFSFFYDFSHFQIGL